MNALLITGTESGAGKTILTSALIAYWQRYLNGPQLGVIKPIDCGSSDPEHYHRLLNQSIEEISPVRLGARLPAPIAAYQAKQSIDLEKIWRQFEILSHEREFVLVEGIGGLGSPMTAETTVADLAWDWRIPAVLVVPVQPGTIPHAVANVALANQARLHLKGIVLNCLSACHAQELEDWAPVDLIESLTQKPVLGCIPHLPDPTDQAKLAQVASNLELERLLPGG